MKILLKKDSWARNENEKRKANGKRIFSKYKKTVKVEEKETEEKR